MPLKKIWIAVLFPLVLSCKGSGPASLSETSLGGTAIGTTYTIKYLDSEKRSFEKDIDSLIASVNASLSTYVPGSAISRINRGDTTVVVDAYFKEVFQKSKQFYRETQGFFDPTVGPLVNAWGFGPNMSNTPPDASEIRQLLTLVGFDKVQLYKDRVQKQFPEIYLDFNAIGKGYLIDVIGRMFEQHQIEHYMIEIGGEIRARGLNKQQKVWRIAIENPHPDGSRSFATVLPLADASMATSGNYRKYREDEQGRKYVHTIHPMTGHARPSNLLSVSVIAHSDCADVDAYATAFMAMGLEATRTFLAAHPELKAFLIYTDAAGNLATYHSENLMD
ncbi:MAG: FAD:protein FMN transferase [Lutibacter sp.]|nr:FAD:protein FMN transferase [Lutibacter sp.]